VIRAALRFFRLMPAALDRAHLLLARNHLSKHRPLHPDLPWIVSRIAELENMK
jgi:hypothetical protein